MKNIGICLIFILVSVGIVAQTVGKQSPATVKAFNYYGEIGEILPFTVDFSPSQSAITTEGYANIKNVATFLQNHPNVKIVVAGFTRKGKNAASSQKLSEDRTNSVRTTLINKHKIDANRILISGEGEDKGLIECFSKTSDAVIFFDRSFTIDKQYGSVIHNEVEAKNAQVLGLLARVIFSGAGTGETSCTYCNGTGYVMGAVCPKCGGSQIMYDEDKAAKEQKEIVNKLGAAQNKQPKSASITHKNGYSTDVFSRSYYEGYKLNDERNGRGIAIHYDPSDNYAQFVFAYSGEWKNGQRTGKGVLRTAAGNRIFGTFNNGVLTGKGAILTMNDDIYIGDIVNNKCNGKGKLYLKTGGTYEGEVKDGLYHGLGTLVTIDGTKYTGTFKWGKENGKGKKEYADGTIYEGEFKEGEYYGNGIMTMPNGIIFEGDFKEGQRNGGGMLKWGNDSMFVGIFKDNNMFGTGTMFNLSTHEYKNGLWYFGKLYQLKKKGTYKDYEMEPGYREVEFENGDTYAGEFKYGVFHGKGKYKYADGRLYSGRWEYGTHHGKGTLQFPNGDCYDGDFTYGFRTGKGSLLFRSGTKYKGEFKDGQFHGRGTIFYNNKTFAECDWEYGEPKKGIKKGTWFGNYVRKDKFDEYMKNKK